MGQDPKQPQQEREPLKGGKPEPHHPEDDAQRQDEPEKLHGDPVRTPGGDSKEKRPGR